MKKAQPELAITKEQKKELLVQLEDKSAREGQRIILSISPPQVLLRERERMVGSEHTEVSFLINQELKASLAEVRALLGSKGANLNMAELIAEMASLSKERLSEKRFGKVRAQQARLTTSSAGIKSAQAIHSGAGVTARKRSRYISQATRHAVWRKAGGKCASCGATHRLQVDHVRPFALGGDSSPENLQLLCSSCNLRRGVVTFGGRTMRRA